MATLSTNQHKQKMISELMSDKENLLAGVNSVLTPSRRPFKLVQENTVGTPEALTTLKKRVARSSLTPGVSQKNKRKSKRLSIPVHVFRKNLKQNTKVKSTLTLPLGISEVREKDIAEESSKSEIKINFTDSRKHESKDEKVIENVEQRSEKREEKDEEKELDLMAETVVKQVFEDIAGSTKQNQDTESYERKIQEFTQIILQMNKERLDLEKQLSIHKKEQQPSRIKEKCANPSNKRFKESRNNLDLEKKLSQKTKEIQQLKRELQQTLPGGKKSKAHPEKELEAKKGEIKQLKTELSQLQHQVREVLGLRNELQKSRQQVSQLNEVAFACRRENNNQKTLIAKMQKELTSKETRAKQHLEHCENNTRALKKELSEKEKMLHEVQESARRHAQEVEACKMQSKSMCGITDRLEAFTVKAQKFKSTAELKVRDLSRSLEAKEQHCMSLEEQLESSRNESKTCMQECEHLKVEVKALQQEVCVGHLEISRQQGVITSLEQQLEKMRVKNCQYQDQLELIQLQQQETNEFLEEERRTIEETAREMEKELEETRHKGMKLDETFRETTVRCVELEHQVKLSRSLYLEKQEELDATQSQAHCIMFELQNEITDAQESIADVWGVLDDLLRKFREQARLGCLQAQNPKVIEDEKFHTQAPAPRSLVQSVLAAVAKGTTPESLEDTCDEEQPSLTLCSQISELKQGLLELAQIGYGQTASDEAMQKIAELEENRKSMKLSYKQLVQSLQSELDTCRARESDMKADMERQQNEVDYLTNTLDNMREQLKQTIRENHSLSHLIDVEAEQKQKIKLLNEELVRKDGDYKKLQSEKECILEQLNETIARVNELCANPANQTSLPGKILEEKFAMERKLKQIKEKYLDYRFETDDKFNQQKITSNQKIYNLERNLGKAEAEISRLDEILEKIRIVLHKNQAVVDDCVPLSKVLKFLDGDEHASEN